jgi:hypothetical protein
VPTGLKYIYKKYFRPQIFEGSGLAPKLTIKVVQKNETKNARGNSAKAFLWACKRDINPEPLIN